MAVRSGGWIFNRLGPNGLPMDIQFHTRFLQKLRTLLPYSWICWYYENFFFNERFNHKLYGIERGNRCFSGIIIISDALPIRILSGQIIAKNNIDRFTEDGVIFTGKQMITVLFDDRKTYPFVNVFTQLGEEKETKCDLVVMATGFHYNFPLIDKSLYEQPEDKMLDMYKQVFPQHLPHYSLAVIGAIQPNGGLFALFEMQARWYAMLMTGKCQFPTHDQIVADIAETNRKRDQIYYDSPRNNLGVDWISYMDAIAEIIGVKPDLQKYILTDTMLYMKLVFGPCLPYQYRLKGNHSWSGARDAVIQSDYRVRYALNPREAKFGNGFLLTPNFYRIIISLILFLFAFIAIEFFD